MRLRSLVVALLTASAMASCVPAHPEGAPVSRGAEVFREQGCYGCHTIGKTGTPIATDLSRIGARMDEKALAAWLRDPALYRPTAHMPKIQLSEAEVRALAAYLASQR